MAEQNARLIAGKLLGLGLLLALVLWTHLEFSPQYDESAHLAFSEYLAHHPVMETVKTYKGSQNYEAKGPAFFLIAAAFGKTVGFELKRLRLLTLVFSIAALAGFRLLLRLAPGASAESAVFLMFLPYYLILSITFMTDVPSLSLLIFGLYGYLKFIETDNIWYAILGVTSITLVAYVRVDYLYVLGGITLGCLIHSQLTPRLALLILLPVALRIPLLLAWGGLAPPAAQARGHAVALGFNPSYLIFSLAVVGLYFWPFLIDKLISETQRAFRSFLIAFMIVAPLSIFLAPQISADNVDQYGGTLRSLMLALRLSHVSQVIVWTVFATIGTAACSVLTPSKDKILFCIQAACTAGLLMQMFRGQVIYERYLLEVSPLLLLLLLRRTMFGSTAWYWSAWMLGTQLMQFYRKAVL